MNIFIAKALVISNLDELFKVISRGHRYLNYRFQTWSPCGRAKPAR